MEEVNKYLSGIGLPIDKIIDWALIIWALIIALFASKIIAWFIWKGIKKANFMKKSFEKLWVNLDLEKTWNIISKVIYFLLIFTIFVIILKLFKVDSTDLPLIWNLQDFVNKWLWAIIIAFVAWFLASLAKVTIIKWLKSSDFEKKVSENIKTNWSLAENIWNISYWVIILFFLPKILNNFEQTREIWNQIDVIFKSFMNYLPDLFAASLIVVIFFFVWKILSKIISDSLSWLGFDKVLDMIGIKNINSTTKPSSVVWNIAFAYIILFALIEASKRLGFDKISNIVNQIIVFVTNILIWVIVLAIGMYLANLASKAIKSATDSKVLPMVAKVWIVILTSFMALQQMQIWWEIVNQAFTLLLWALAVAFALAVWLGSKEVAWEEVKKLIEKMKK